MNWNTCPKHQVDCDSYCTECKRLICFGCEEEHDGHDCVSMTKFVESNEHNFPLASEYSSLIHQLDQEIEEINTSLEAMSRMVYCDKDDLIVYLDQLRVAKQGLSEGMNDKSKLLILILLDQGKLKHAGECEGHAPLEVGPKSDNDKDGNKCTSKTTHEEKGKHDNTFAGVGSSGGNEGDDDTYHLNCTIDQFCAFGGVKKLFDIKKVQEQELVDVGNGILISKPVDIDIPLRVKGKFCKVSVSHLGVVAISSFEGTAEEYHKVRNGQDIKRSVLQLTDLKTRRQRELRNLSLTTVGFYDDKLITLTFNQHLQEGNVEELLSNRNRYAFKHLISHLTASRADTSRLQTTRVLYYLALNKKFYAYNVDTQEEEQTWGTHRLFWVASCTGIDIGAKAVYQDYLERKTYVLKDDNSVSPLMDKTIQYYLNAVFPSSSNEKDLSNAVIKYGWNLIRHGEEMNPLDPIGFGQEATVIRLYKDVFLVLDYNTNKWVLARIIVS